ncbi:sensor histidine kinase [Clostridioides sp. GD02404]|uniref:sensor histidine kinase n=1 Tax=Clostridioides sp. GD02404 TaxID=3054354 RepID=UPI0038A01D5B
MLVGRKSNNKKVEKLRTIFIKYLSLFFIMTISFALLLILSFSVLLSSGVILPANYAEKQFNKYKEKIISSEKVTEDIIPNLYEYGVYTSDGNLISGTFNKKESKEIWNLMSNIEKKNEYTETYIKFFKKDEVFIIKYKLVTEFVSPTLRTYLPRPEILGMIIFSIIFLIEIIILSKLFGKKLNAEMELLKNTTEKIEQQDLDFVVESSKICEINNVLFSMDKMKSALKDSLEKQWMLEENRKEQISALAHDIKTPLTIIHGNTDLLIEINENPELSEYMEYIAKGVTQIEKYINTLIDISKTEAGYVLNKEVINVSEFIEDVLIQIEALARTQNLDVEFSKQDNLPESITIDKELLFRAIMNIISNAIDYSPSQSKLYISVSLSNKYLKFVVTDCGSGFSKADLSKATEQFYTGDLSRNSKSHYGMGLYIVNNIVQKHNGILNIENSIKTGGAMVTIEIPMI